MFTSRNQRWRFQRRQNRLNLRAFDGDQQIDIASGTDVIPRGQRNASHESKRMPQRLQHAPDVVERRQGGISRHRETPVATGLPGTDFARHVVEIKGIDGSLRRIDVVHGLGVLCPDDAIRDTNQIDVLGDLVIRIRGVELVRHVYRT